MKKNMSLLIIFLLMITLSFSLSSCSAGVLGDFYFIQDNKIQQKLTLSITNEAFLITNIYDENDNFIGTDIFKSKWQRFVSAETDENGTQIIDENGKKQYKEDIKLLYYDENNTFREIRFRLINDTLIDCYFNTTYKTFRKFERR